MADRKRPLPDLKVPDLEVRDLKAPDLEVRDLKAPDLEVRDLKVPDLKAPDQKVPDLKAPGLEVRDLTFSYGDRLILRSVSQTFEPGKLYFLAGPNGAGKSTLLLLMAGLLTPRSGTVSVNGRPLASYSPPELARHLALAPQKFHFSLPFTVREMAAMGRRPHLGRWGRLSPEDRFLTEQALDRLNLSHLAGRPVTSLSGGEGQRAVLARTLAQDTGIILLDEPAASLDVAQSLDLMNLLQELAGEGRLIIMAGHDLSLAAVYAREVILFKDGRPAASGPRDRILTAELLARVFE
ncbi:MAG: ABC transporter ATP-binding protein, partial [Deltaproteobacteria bacterium]|nr:ABC transporter ATP-binding protein [Deltaproteobacteria bacterium]